MDDDSPWLEDTWDPRSVTVPRLRAILLLNNVPYPSNARKARLVELFEEHVAPQRQKLREARRHAARIQTRPSEVTDMRAGPGVQTVSASPRTSEVKPEPKSSPRSTRIKQEPKPSPRSSQPKQETSSSPRRSVRRSSSAESIPGQSPAPKGKAPAASTPAPKTSRRSPSASTKPHNAVLVPSQPHSPKPTQPRRSILHPGSEGESDSSRKKLKSRASVTFKDQVEYYDEDADKSNFSHFNPFQQSSPGQSVDAQPSKVTASPRSSQVRDQPEDSATDENTSFSQTLRNALPQSLTSPPRWIGQIQARLAGWEEDSFSGSSFSDEDPEDDGKQGADEVEEQAEEDEDETNMEDWTVSGIDSTTIDRSFDPQSDPSPSMYVWRTRQDRMGTPRSPSPSAKPKRAKTPAKVVGFFFHFLTRLLLWAAAVYIILVYYVRARESRAIGYCDTATESNRELVRRRLIPHSTDVHDPSLLDVVPPSWMPDVCTPCPAHAECRHGVFRGCSTVDYLQADSAWVSLPPPIRAFLPLEWLAPSCVPDTHKLVLALEVGAEVERLLAAWHGEVKCGISPPFEAAAGGRLSLTEREDAGALPTAQLHNDLWDRMESSIDRDYFDQLWDLALAELIRAGEIKVVPDSEAGPYGELVYTPRAAMPLRCRANLAVRTFVRRFRLLGVGVLVLLLSVLWLRHRLAATAQARIKVHRLVQVSLDRLVDAAKQHMLHPNFHPNPWLATTQLRDEVLSHEYSVAQRKRLWARVARIVEENTNVRTRQAKVAGDWVKAWEWIGTTTAFPGGAGGSVDRTLDDQTAISAGNYPRGRMSIGLDPDQTGLSAIEASRFLQTDSADHSGTFGTEPSTNRFLQHDDADRTGVSAFEASRMLQPRDGDQTGVSAFEASRVLQPTEPDMEEAPALNARYF